MTQIEKNLVEVDELLPANLEKVSIVLSIILKAFDLKGQHFVFGLDIRFKEFEAKGIYPEDIRAIIRKIDGISELLEDIRYQFKTWGSSPMADPPLPNIISKEELDEKIFLRITDLENLKQIKESVDKKLEAIKVRESIEIPLNTKKTITKLTIVEPMSPEDTKIKIVLNDEYDKPIKVKKSGHNNYEFLYQIAKGQPMSKIKYPSAVDLFNYNQACKLYSKTGYKPTAILEVEGGFILKAIPMTVITNNQYEKLITQKIKT